jgi:hypothetical protein
MGRAIKVTLISKDGVIENQFQVEEENMMFGGIANILEVHTEEEALAMTALVEVTIDGTTLRATMPAMVLGMIVGYVHLRTRSMGRGAGRGIEDMLNEALMSAFAGDVKMN